MDLAKNTDGACLQFTDSVWGVRAGARNIIFNYDRNGADAIRKLTASRRRYRRLHPLRIHFATSDSGFDADQVLDVHRYDHLKPSWQSSASRTACSPTPMPRSMPGSSVPATCRPTCRSRERGP